MPTIQEIESIMRTFNMPEEQTVLQYLDHVQYTGFYKENKGVSSSNVDQKVTYDVLNVTSLCIKHFTSIGVNSFTIKSFFDDEYCQDLYSARKSTYGGAPLSLSNDASNTSKEFDKLFGQICETLTYTGILSKEFTGRSRIYRVLNNDMINLLASSEEACLCFVCINIWKLIKSANLSEDWYEYVQHQNATQLKQFTKKLKEWFINTTNHNNDIGQITQKIINPLAYLFRCKKLYSNRRTRTLLQSRADLKYFRLHRRDYNRLATLTRLQNLIQSGEASVDAVESDNKELVLQWNRDYFHILDDTSFVSEYMTDFSNRDDAERKTGAHPVHHIWPKGYWNINQNQYFHASIVENLIVLDPTQHLNNGHLNGDTHHLNPQFFSNMLYSQYEKINAFYDVGVGNYKFSQFYKLLCTIENIRPIETENIEIIKEKSEELLHLITVQYSRMFTN